MLQIRASQVFTHSIEDAVAAKKRWMRMNHSTRLCKNIARAHPNNKGAI